MKLSHLPKNIRSKYNVRTDQAGKRSRFYRGILFDSLAELNRYKELDIMQKAGLITGLTLQPVYCLQEAFKDRTGVSHRSVTYVADFAYQERGICVVEDVKGVKTEVYRIKKKFLLKNFPDIEFREVSFHR